jgi:hypothetical protein
MPVPWDREDGMDMDRRKLLAGMVGVGVSSLLPVAPDIASETGGPSTRWHPLTHSLLDRAARLPTRPDLYRITRVVQELSDAQGRGSRPVIKWLETPSDAFDHLSQRGLTALLDMGESTFWRAGRPLRLAERAAERMIELRGLAAEILRVDDRDRLLMEPKLAARRKAVAAIGASPEAIFQGRAVAAQIGWLETSLSSIAADAVCRVEVLLSSDVSDCSETIRHQVLAFEVHEHGLLATWETLSEMICVPTKV